MINTAHFPDAETVKETAPDLRAMAPSLGVTLYKKTPREAAGPCPRCGGRDRLTVQAARWSCRQCSPRWGDCFDFVELATGCTFPQAVKRVADMSGTIPSGPPADLYPLSDRGKKAVDADQAPDYLDDWLLEAVPRFRAALKQNKPVIEYLQRRGISGEAAAAWHLGARSYSGNGYDRAAAVAMPAMGRDGQPIGLKYRIVNPAPTGPKCLNAKGTSGATLFGLHLLAPSHQRALLVCEGELNAVSLWQAARSINAPLDVVSFGSEGNSLSAWGTIKALSGNYGTTIVWADQPEVSSGLGMLLEWEAGGAYCQQSPYGKDANDLLQAGLLESYITGLLYRLHDSLSPLIARAHEYAHADDKARLWAREERLTMLAVAVLWGWSSPIRKESRAA